MARHDPDFPDVRYGPAIHEIMRETFTHRLRSPVPWVNTAEALKAGGDTLWRRNQTAIRRLVHQARAGLLEETKREKRWHLASGEMAMMLWGLALENLLKGIAVRREWPRGFAGDRLPDHLDEHRVANLLEWSAASMSTAERKLADRQQQAVLWSGRYSNLET